LFANVRVEQRRVRIRLRRQFREGLPLRGCHWANNIAQCSRTAAAVRQRRAATLTVNASTQHDSPLIKQFARVQCFVLNEAERHWSIHYAWPVDGSSFRYDSPTLNVDTTSLSVGGHSVRVTVQLAPAGSVVSKRNA